MPDNQLSENDLAAIEARLVNATGSSDVFGPEWTDFFNHSSRDIRGLLAEVRRLRVTVAPDRETLAKALCRINHDDRSIEELVAPDHALWMRFLPEADALLASGVLGVPAVQRTADRETIEHALRGAHLSDGTPITHSWQEFGSLADAVLAVLVPADRPEPVVLVTTPASGGVTTDTIFDPQMAYERGRRDADQAVDLIRAETLEGMANEFAPGLVDPAPGAVRGVDSVRAWLRARAAEYRKAAGA